MADEAGVLAEKLSAIASVQRMRIVAELTKGPQHVSELARRMQMSRALLYMHLRKLEEAGFVSGTLHLTDDGKALNVFTVKDFDFTINPEVIADAAASHSQGELS